MRQDELDRVLLMEPEIVASPGFTKSVMAAVRREAATPPPIPFPWHVALPGPILCAIAILWSLAGPIHVPMQDSSSQWFDRFLPTLNTAQMFGAGWVLLGLLLTFAGLKLTWNLAGRRI